MSDFLQLKTMGMSSKIHLLEYFCNCRDEKSLSEKEAVVASQILLEWMSNPSFLPEELKPENWH